MSKMIKCKTCGAEIASSAKTCPSCGAKNKKPLYTKWWFWLVILILVVDIFGNDDSTKNTSTTTAPTSTNLESISKDSENTDEKSDDIKEDEVAEDTAAEDTVTKQENKAEKSSKLSKEDVFKVIEISAKGNFDTVDIQEREETPGLYYVMVTKNGFAQSTYGAKGTNSKEYNDMKNSFQALCAQYNDALEQNNIEGAFVVCLMNDLNKDNVLFMTTETTVISSAYE